MKRFFTIYSLGKVVIYHNEVTEAADHYETMEKLMIAEVFPVEFLKER